MRDLAGAEIVSGLCAIRVRNSKLVELGAIIPNKKNELKFCCIIVRYNDKTKKYILSKTHRSLDLVKNRLITFEFDIDRINYILTENIKEYLPTLDGKKIALEQLRDLYVEICSTSQKAKEYLEAKIIAEECAGLELDHESTKDN